MESYLRRLAYCSESLLKLITSYSLQQSYLIVFDFGVKPLLDTCLHGEKNSSLNREIKFKVKLAELCWIIHDTTNINEWTKWRYCHSELVVFKHRFGGSNVG